MFTRVLFILALLTVLPAGAQVSVRDALMAPVTKIAPADDFALAVAGVMLISEPDLTVAGQRMLDGTAMAGKAEKAAYEEVRKRLSDAVTSLDCWWRHGPGYDVTCATRAQLEQTLRDFSPLIDRYVDALKRPQSTALRGDLSPFMSLNRLLFAKCALLGLRNEHAKALSLWAENQRALIRLRLSGAPVLYTAVGAVMENDSLESLEGILFRAPEFAAEDRKRVLDLISSPSFSRDRILADLRAEYRLLEWVLKESKVKERFAHYALERQIEYSTRILPLLLSGEAEMISARSLNDSWACKKSNVSACAKKSAGNPSDAERFRLEYFSPLGIEIMLSMRRRDYSAQLVGIRLGIVERGGTISAARELAGELSGKLGGKRVMVDEARKLIHYQDMAVSSMEVRLGF